MDKQHYEAIFKEIDLDYYESDFKYAEAFFEYWWNDKDHRFSEDRLEMDQSDIEEIAFLAYHAGRLYQESLHSGALGI